MSAISESVSNPDLRRIAEKVESGTPVDRSDAELMLRTPDILDLGSIATHLRWLWNGPTTYYSVNMNLNYTNICILRCPLCAYSCNAGDKEAFVLSLDEIQDRIEQAVAKGIDEVHIVGGLNPELSFDYYQSMIRRIKSVQPDLFVVAFTAVEYDFFSRQLDIPLSEVFDRLIHAGVDALPGGGAEIFAPGIREKIAPDKISGDRWLEVMRTAHEKGLETNATLLYNQHESAEDIIDHLFRLRDLQDETQGFKTFVPLRFHGKNTRIDESGRSSGFNDVRLYATARIALHNFPHVKALWMYLGERVAQVMQHFGADDLGATYHHEKVVHAAGASTADRGSEPFLRRIIENAGFEPRRTNAGYGRIRNQISAINHET